MGFGGRRGARITRYSCAASRRIKYITKREGVFAVFGRRRVLGLLTVLVLALLLVACGGRNNQQSSTSSSTTSTPAASSTSSTSSSSSTSTSGVREITLVFNDFAFEPQEIRVKSGERVRLVIRNNGSVAHDWYVDALDLNTPRVLAGQSATFEFTAGAAGRYEVICTEPGHEALGMTGWLIIE